ncbi:class I SAM-dependent methyltransferase [Micromonospora sp. NPDC023633]|uniref:class I SAM-dependent methyltransferase n=1 Tax=Micromonospora sp. NPDC023633 TaxID=3154320 RepID=UPI00340659BC
MPDASIETQQTYDVIASTYTRVNSAVDSRLLEDIALLTARLSPGATVADVGCGPGREIALLQEHGLRVIGLDLSFGQLRTGGQPGVAQADMRRLPLQSDSVDAIWCQAALLHVPHREVPAVLDQFARTLRLGGQLYLNVTEGDGEGWEIASNYGSDRRRWFTFHQLSGLTGLLTAAGFEVHHVTRTQASRTWLAVHAHRVNTSTLS